MAKPFKTPSSELADITVNHFAIQHAWEKVPHSSKPVDEICHDKHQAANTSHNGNGHTPPAPSKDGPNGTWQHPASRTNCPTWDSHCSKCNKIGHWGPKCCSGKPPQPKNAPLPRNAPLTGSQHWKSSHPPRSHNHCPGRGGKTDAIDVGKDHSPQDEIALYGIQANVTTVATACAAGNTRGAPTHDELFIDAINYGTIGNTHPKEIMVGDVWAHSATKHTPLYSCLQVPAEEKQPHSISRSTLELEIMCCPSMYFDVFIKTRSVQLACPLAWITSAPDSLPIMDPIYPYMVHSVAPSLGGQAPWCSTWVNSYWYVADTPGSAILGLPSCKRLAVMKMNCTITVMWPSTKPPSPAPVSTTETIARPATVPSAAKSIRSTDDLIKEFPDWFTGIGRFPGEYKIWLWHDVHPVIHAPRRCPITLHPKVKEHLNKMEHLGVITHVDEPADWVSSITYVQKANGKLHLCLDPHDLNEAICWDHHKMPTVEEVTCEFAHSHYFIKLDAHHGYWSIVLNQESSLLTTFNSPFRRYHFLLLPFGLVCSQDIFQKKMDQVLEECQGCIRIADITIPGCTEVEHEGHLWNLMWIAHKYDLVFNPQKTHVKAQAINFFGCLYDANGVHLDLGMVNAKHTLPAPTNITKLQEFLGLVTYLSPFIPGLSTLTAPCMSCSIRTQTSPGTTPSMLLFSMSKKLSSVTPPSGTSTPHFPWQYKSMPHR